MIAKLRTRIARSEEAGFALIELLNVIVIIAVLERGVDER